MDGFRAYRTRVLQIGLGISVLVATLLPWTGLRAQSSDQATYKLVTWGSGWGDRNAFEISSLCAIAVAGVSALLVARAAVALHQSSKSEREIGFRMDIGLAAILVVLVLLLIVPLSPDLPEGIADFGVEDVEVVWQPLFGAWLALASTIALVLLEIARAIRARKRATLSSGP
ncbi:MAG: hypothetical protein HYX29_06460 [Solirubrobacterales bacterium]|nr:hypothetical protein [Solirubrobacterales bacterium]